MNKFKLLGLFRHLLGAGGAIAVGFGLAEPDTVNTVTTAAGEVAETVATATPSFTEALGALATIAAFAWSYFAPEKKG
jgi:hypothetical protein